MTYNYRQDIVKRIYDASTCTDCDHIPKIHRAGAVENGIQFMHNGLKVVEDCYCGAWMTDLIRESKGHHEPQEEKAFYEVLKKIPDGGVMLELGSYWAYYSMWFNKSIKNAVNYMVEPETEFLEAGKANFVLNDLNGTFIQEAVPQFRVDNFLVKNNINHINILHADIQGFEYRLLLDTVGCFDKISYIFVSTHSPSLHNDCLNLLKSHNRVILCHHTLEQSRSVDGLIVARNPTIDIDFNSIEITS